MEASRPLDAFSVEFVGFWVARGTDMKRSSKNKVLPDFGDKALMEPIPRKGLLFFLISKDW